MKSLSVTIQMKAVGRYFPVVLFVAPYKVVLMFLWIKFVKVTLQINATKLYFTDSDAFIMLYKEHSKV